MAFCGFTCLFIISILICFIYKIRNNHFFIWFLKYSTYFILVMFTGALMFPFACLRPMDAGNIMYVAMLWSRLFKIFNISYTIRNQEYLDSKKPFILVCNHQSAVDLIAMMNFLPYRCTALAKKSLKFFGPFGLTSWLCGLVFVDRLNHEKAKKTMDETAKHLHEKNIKLWVFPEGTRNMNGDLLPFKKGAFHLAVQAQVPIVPLVLSSYKYFLSAEHQYFSKGHVIVTVLPPVSTEGLTSADVNNLTDKIYDQMRQVFIDSSKEIEQMAREKGEVELLNKIEQKQK